MTNAQKLKLAKLVEELDKYRAAYYDSLTWGGPTIYPTNPMTPERCFEVTKLLKEILEDR